MSTPHSRPSRGRLRSGTIPSLPSTTSSISPASTILTLAPAAVPIALPTNSKNSTTSPSGATSAGIGAGKTTRSGRGSMGHSRTVSSTGILQSTSSSPSKMKNGSPINSKTPPSLDQRGLKASQIPSTSKSKTNNRTGLGVLTIPPTANPKYGIQQSQPPTPSHFNPTSSQTLTQTKSPIPPSTTPPTSSRLTLNIHMSSAFDGTPVVMDRNKLPWAEVGDIVQARPEDDDAMIDRREGDNDDAEDVEDEEKIRKRKRKGSYLFRIEENDEAALKRLNTWSGLSVIESVADVFGFSNRLNMEIVKVDPSTVEADFIELYFTGQYLGRADMWRLGMFLEGKCVHVREKIEFSAGMVRAEVKAVYIKGKRVMSALITARTKTIFRSKSAQSFIFLQLCREMYEFDEDGERYYEKALYGFLPELFTRWKKTQANHVVTFILFARVYYVEEDVEHLRHLGRTGEDALRYDEHLGYYKDFYKVIVDAELRAEWDSLLPTLKREVMETHSHILLNHHLEEDESKEAKIIGRLSFAHEGNILECLNLVLNPFDESYIDRDLSRTGLSMVMVTPGTGHFTVNKHLLRLTTERILEHGICLDLVNLTQIPLHSVPVFSFYSTPPIVKPEDARGKQDVNGADPLYYDDAHSAKDQQERIYHSLPFWVYCSFYSKSHDKPFRIDRFIPRCKMYEVQMLGMLDHDLTEVSIPILDVNMNLPDEGQESASPTEVTNESRRAAMLAYDANIFKGNQPPGRAGFSGLSSHGSQLSLKGTSGTQIYSTSYQSNRLEPFREASDQDSRSSSYRDQSIMLTIGNNANRRPSNADAPLGEDVATPTARSSPKLSSAGVVTPVKATSPTDPKVTIKDPVTPHTLAKKASKTSISSKASVPRSWFLRFTSRAAPSQPTAAVESVERQAVSNNNSPAALATQTSQSSHNGSPVSIAARASPATLPIVKLPTPAQQPAVAPPSFQADLSTAQPITITQRGKTAEPPRRRRLIDTSDDNSRTVTTVQRRQSTELHGSLPHVSSGSWRAQIPGPLARTEAFELNPCRPFIPKVDRTGQSRKWKHGIPKQTFQHEIKWDSVCAPACLPLTNEYLPSEWQLSTQYELSTHEVDVDVSFLLRPGLIHDLPLAVMRELASQRLSQNFQFITLPPFRSAATSHSQLPSMHTEWRRMHLRQGGPSEVFKENGSPLYLSTHNYVHVLTPMQLSNTIGVECFTRKINYKTDEVKYDCLIWPRQRQGYHHAQATFRFPDLANRKAFSYLDRLITGKVDSFTDDLRYWRTRFILIPSDKDTPPMTGPKGEPLKTDEIHILGAAKLLESIAKQRWKNPNTDQQLPPPKLLPTWLDPSACILDESLMAQLEQVHTRPSVETSIARARIADAPLAKIVEMMRDSKTGLRIGDLWWQRMQYPDSFTGEAFVDWLQRTFEDLPNREAALEYGTKLQERGLIEHCVGNHGFLDGHYFYRIREEYGRNPQTNRAQRWFAKGFLRDSNAPKDLQPDSIAIGNRGTTINPFGLTPPSEHSMGVRGNRKRKIVMSQTMIIDLDVRNRKSDRAEGAILHCDIIHNPANGFHFELNWLGVSVGLLDETRQRWGREAEKYGLRLVEAPVEQIKDIGRKYAYRSCYPIKLVLPPPAVADLDLRLPEAIRTAYFFEYAILTRKFGFVLDVEANTRYPDDVTVEYSYRKAVFDHSQFVHKTGLALVQCLGGTDGFLWSHNRLFFSAQSRSANQNKASESYLVAHDRAERMCEKLEAFCNDPRALAEFYDSVIPPMPMEVLEGTDVMDTLEVVTEVEAREEVQNLPLRVDEDSLENAME